MIAYKDTSMLFMLRLRVAPLSLNPSCVKKIMKRKRKRDYSKSNLCLATSVQDSFSNTATSPQRSLFHAPRPPGTSLKWPPIHNAKDHKVRLKISASKITCRQRPVNQLKIQEQKPTQRKMRFLRSKYYILAASFGFVYVVTFPKNHAN